MDRAVIFFCPLSLDMNKYKLDHLFFNITNRCNLECKYCYDNSSKPIRKFDSGSSLNLKQIEMLAFEAKECGAKKVTLSGGEPFARNDWYEIFSIFDNLGFSLAISTNGTLINKEIVNKLSNFKDIIFQISIDGAKITHEKIRGKVGCFDKTISTVNLLKKFGFDVQINCVIFKENYWEIPFLYNISQKYRIITRLTLLSDIFGRGKSVADKSLSIKEINNLIKAIHYARKQNTFIYFNLPPLLLPIEDVFPISPSCGWAKGQCGVLHNGDVTICGLSSGRKDLVAGNIKNKSFKKIWFNSELFKKLRSFKADEIKGICGLCPVIEECGGSCRLEPYLRTEDHLSPNHYCQMYYEALLSKEISGGFPSQLLNLN